MARTLPKYKCVHAAREVSHLLNLPRPLHWTEAHEYYQPRLFGGGLMWLKRYDRDTQDAIRRSLDREGRYLHVWTP